MKGKRIYRIYVDHPVRGWIPVGVFYRTKKDALGWKSFVRAAWRICDVEVVWAASRLPAR